MVIIAPAADGPNWADIVTAVATGVLALLALVTAWYARKAFRKQSEEVRLLGEQNTRDIEERRRAQAAQVFIMIEGSEMRPGVEKQLDQVILKATVRNTSQLPVYDLWVRWRTVNGEFGIPTVAPQFLPGETKPVEVIWSEAAGMEETGVSLDFRDAAGLHWRTTDRGILTELCGAESPSPALNRCTFAPEHHGPHSWEQEFKALRQRPDFPLRPAFRKNGT